MRVTLLVAVLALTACASEAQEAEFQITPPCTPIEGQQQDPCDQAFDGIQVMIGGGGFDDDGRPPISVEDLAFGADSPNLVAHIVVRATSLPNTSRCVSDVPLVPPTFLPDDAYSSMGPGFRTIDCYLDYRVNEYIVGSGPDTLTVQRFFWSYGVLWFQDDPDELEDARQALELAMGNSPINEEVLALIPTTSVVTEEWEMYNFYNVQRDGDGNAQAVHPERNTYREYAPELYERHKAELEMPLATLKSRLKTAYAAMVSENSGRIGADIDLPDLVTNASNLRGYFEDAGGYDNRVPLKAPPPCGLAAGQDKPLLMLDCIALLEAKDELRGTGALNWSVDTAIGSWDGVTTSGSGGGASGASGSTGSQVTKVELVNKGLTGSIPEELEELDLEVLKLSGNSLTGCIPVGLKDVPTNDLSSLNLLYCKPPAPAPIAWAVGETTFQLTWPAIANAGTYRLEHRLATADAWTTASDTITATEYSVSGLECGTEYEFRLSALGSGTVYAAAWSDPWEVAETTTPCVTPVFDQTSYAFSVREATAVSTSIGVVSATDPNGDAVSYRITSGNDDGTFVVSGVTSERSRNTLILAKSLDYETTPSYTLTVEARDRFGNASSVTVKVAPPNDAPVFGREAYAFSVAENTGQYEVIGTVAATDADGDTPTYHITAGNGAGKFSIDANAGFIVVRGTLDYETTSSYTLTVEARDGKGGVDSATVTITVTDAAE